MNCKYAKSQIALLIGGDLDDRAERALKQHLAVCGLCCRHHESMHSTLAVLQESGQANDQETAALESSLWPHLQARLAIEERGRGRSRFNGWPPAVAVAAACLLIALAVGNRPQARPNHNDNGFGVLAEMEQASQRSAARSETATGHSGGRMLQFRSWPPGERRLEPQHVLHQWPPRTAEPSYWPPPADGQRLWHFSLPR